MTIGKQTMVFENTTHYRITFPQDILPHTQGIQRKTQEHFIAILLNGAHEIIKKVIITKGLVNRTIVHPREVFRPAIRFNATALIVAHNHPSGSTNPSQEDIDVTSRLKAAGALIGIDLLDHIIISRRGYYSFLENNQL